MNKKLKFTVEVEDENGNVIAASESERMVPYIEEMEEQGFRQAFHTLETAILESRKEVSDGILSDYLELASLKKRNNPGEK